jgi:site-specific recombinase XerD
MTLLLADVLRDYYAPVKGISDRTMKLYGFTLKSFGQHLGHEPTTADLDQYVVARFLAWRLREREPATAAKDRAQLRALWSFSFSEGLPGVVRGPQVRRVVVPERVPEAWLEDQMRTLIQAASAESGSICGVKASDWWRSLLLCCFDTAERISATRSLTFGDVRGTLVIFRADERKGRRRDIARTISADTALAIDKIAEPRRQLVWPCDVRAPAMYHRFDRILKRAGLPTDRWSKFHRIRKTTASYYEAAGGNAQSLLDHSSPAVTRRYLDPRIVMPEIGDAPSRLPRVV